MVTLTDILIKRFIIFKFNRFQGSFKPYFNQFDHLQEVWQAFINIEKATFL